MAISHMNRVIHQFRKLAIAHDAVERTDGQLLECFVSRREEAALEALVLRHGPMVWGVCRRLLNHHDAEDAFQATFLVLVRKAASIVPREMVGNWLYGVAHQAALNARTRIAKRRAREVQVTEMPEPAVIEQDLWRELQPILDQELSRLPDKYRVAIVLCDLEGKARKEASRQLGLPEGTVASRLARGRAMLAKRLARHGLVLSGGTLAAVLSQKAASAAVSTSVMTCTIKAVTLGAAGRAAAGAISVKAAALTKGVLKAMFLTKLKTATALLVVLAVVAAGAGGLFYQTHAAGQSQPPQAAKTTVPQGQAAAKRQEERVVGKETDGDGKDKEPDSVGELWSDYWRRQHKGVKPSAFKVELAPAAKVTRTRTGIVLPIKITNHSSEEIVTQLAHEWHGGEWPTTDLYASVTPRQATKVKLFAPVYLAEENQNLDRRIRVAPGKSANVELRMDWPGTGSQPAIPFMETSASGIYRVRLLMVFEVKEGRQFVASAEKAVELLAK
jgi:RNA polymerase sigma factor (sigma-70 family)